MVFRNFKKETPYLGSSLCTVCFKTSYRDISDGVGRVTDCTVTLFPSKISNSQTDKLNTNVIDKPETYVLVLIGQMSSSLKIEALEGPESSHIKLVAAWWWKVFVRTFNLRNLKFKMLIHE